MLYSFKRAYPVLVIILGMIGISINQSCKKDPPLEDPQPPTIYASQFSGAPNGEGIQAEIVNQQENITVRIFGSFDGQGKPDVSTSMTVERIGSDTTLNFLLDDFGRISSLYASFGGNIRDTMLHKFDYYDNDSVAYSVYSYNANSDSSSLIHFAVGVFQNNSFAGSIIYSRSLYGTMSWNAGVQAISHTFYTVTGVAVSVGIGILGASIGAPVLGILGTATVMMAWFTNSANAGYITQQQNGNSLSSPVASNQPGIPTESHLYLYEPRYELTSGGPCGKLIYAVTDFFKPNGATIDSIRFYGSYLNFDYSCGSGSTAVTQATFTTSISSISGSGQLIISGNKIMRWMSDAEPVWEEVNSFVPYGYELIGTYKGKATRSNRAHFN
jgi:hypothetical protein